MRVKAVSSRKQQNPSLTIRKISENIQKVAYLSQLSNSVEKRSLLETFRFPLCRRAVLLDELKRDHDWFIHHALLSWKRSPSVIDTTFLLQLRNADGTTGFRVVNARTVDMAFSSSNHLAVACNCIKGGSLSIMSGASLLKQDELVTPLFNTSLSKPTQLSYPVNRFTFCNP